MEISALTDCRVSVVCRANEVRSRIIEGYLMNRYHQFEIRSFGIDVDFSRRISSGLTQEMAPWGIEINQTAPTSVFTELDFVKSSDLVVSADGAVSERLSLDGIQSINICDFAIDELHVPVDPLNFSNDLYFANAAKVLHCTSRMISHVMDEQLKLASIWTYVTSEEIRPNTFRKDAILIDARVRHSSGVFSPFNKTRFFEEREILDGSLIATLQSGIKFYSPKYEFREPEKTLLSNQWKHFLIAVSAFGAIDVITTPLRVNGRRLWDPYLASILAERVEYL